MISESLGGIVELCSFVAEQSSARISDQVVDGPESEVAEHVMGVSRLVSAICATCETRTALSVSVEAVGAVGGCWWLFVGWQGKGEVVCGVGRGDGRGGCQCIRRCLMLRRS